MWSRKGSCVRCGQCCIHEMFYKPMLNDDKVCKYLKREDNIYTCLIRVNCNKDGHLKKKTNVKIPISHWKYWFKECKQYPNPNNPAHTPTNNHSLLPECGFIIYESDD